MKEAKCPICRKSIRSDATQHEFCALCGMGIEDPMKSPHCQSKDGKMLFFCCPICLSVYMDDIEKSAETD